MNHHQFTYYLVKYDALSGQPVNVWRDHVGLGDGFEFGVVLVGAQVQPEVVNYYDL